MADAQRISIRLADQPGDLGWVVKAHGEVYAAEYGWDQSFEALVARIVADFAGDHNPARQAGWIAEAGGRRAGCVLCVAADQDTAELHTLLTLPDFRGLGIGSSLVHTCMDFARTAGYRRMALWTNSVLGAAIRIYLASGFRLTGEEKHHSFGADLVGQTYEADLARSTVTR